MYNRFRDDDKRTVPSTSLIQIRKNASTLVTPLKGPTSGEYKFMYDNVTRPYRREINQGAILNKEMHSEKIIYSGGGSGWKEQETNPVSSIPDGYELSRDWGVGLGIGTALPTIHHTDLAAYSFPLFRSEWANQVIDELPMITSASTKALGNIKRPDLQGQVLVAELNKTIQTLRNPIKAITDYVLRGGVSRRRADGTKRTDRQRNVAAEKRLTKAVADQHLSIYYGILPVMADVEGILKALQRKVAERYTARATEQQQTVRTAITSPPITASFSVFKYQDTCTETVAVRAGSLYECYADSQFSFFGFGLSDMPASAWELVPYSFVVDWLLNVGELISALTPMADVSRLAEWHVVTRTCTYNRRVISHANRTDTPNWQFTRQNEDWQEVLYRRHTRVPVNLGRYVGLRFKPSLTKGQTLAAISLAIQNLTRGK